MTGGGGQAAADRLFHTGPDDLAANRAGRLGPGQIARLQHNARSMWVIAFLLGGVLVVPLIERLVDGHKPPLILSSVVAAAGVLVFSGFGRYARKLAAVADNASVSSVVGQVRFVQAGRVVTVHVGERTGLSMPGGLASKWQRLFGDAEWQVYVRDSVGMIVGAEPVAPPSP